MALHHLSDALKYYLKDSAHVHDATGRTDKCQMILASNQAFQHGEAVGIAGL